MNIAWFPFDHHMCTLTFGSWSYTSKYLNYTCRTEEPSLKNFTDNVEWILVKYKPIRIENKYEHWIEDDYFSEIKYKILIKRKPLFVLQSYVSCALILSILTLVSFFIPFAQQMQIEISILLTFAVFKLRLSDDVPAQSNTIPLINIYYFLCMTFSLASMIWFSIIDYLRERKKSIPKIARNIILDIICKIMFIKTDQLIKSYIYFILFNVIYYQKISIFTGKQSLFKPKSLTIDPTVVWVLRDGK
jgi:5-hydroxytryptamine receptor 3